MGQEKETHNFYFLTSFQKIKIIQTDFDKGRILIGEDLVGKNFDSSSVIWTHLYTK